ncbi:MAG: hypothetical protein U9R19_11475, partial [Bacteroidota bacterium]|nr:hypothetical protein [Bacteroidota bacterium]
PTVFTVAHGATYEAEYEFDEYDVNFDAIKCTWVSGGQYVGHITANDGVGTTSNISPVTAGPVFSVIEYMSLEYLGNAETNTFEITH